MQYQNTKNHKLRISLFTFFVITIISISGFTVYAMQSVNISLEVKEPLKILDYPTSFSLYSGETVNFEFTMENYASVIYFQEFDFILNDTDYQKKYVTFSNHNYSIPPGTTQLQAWLTISPNAPPANFMITINKKTDTPTPVPLAISYNNTKLNPTLQLLSGGINWAAQEGKSALYISWKANWEEHKTTDGSNWEYRSESQMNSYQNTILTILEDLEFEITLVGDIPENLTGYDFVLIHAYYAIEPQHGPQIRDYIGTGGSVVMLTGAPIFLTGYSKTMTRPGESFESVKDWFGASTYANTGGIARVAFDDPFDTSLSMNEVLYTGIFGHAAVTSLRNASKAIAFWDSGEVFAFTHEYGFGRLYYQAGFECISNNLE